MPKRQYHVLTAFTLKLIFASFVLFSPVNAVAQDQSWIQIEARPSQSLALERARDYSTRLERVQGYRLPSGWYAITLGPYPNEQAASLLARLRGARLVPSDSFLADGRGFRQQFWPPFGSNLTLQPTAVAPEVQEAPVISAPTAETLEEARAATRALTRAEREDIQRALQWDGFYTARIDGSFGPGTRRAIEAWQFENSYPATGVLQTAQRKTLIDTYLSELNSLGLTETFDSEAGISLVVPSALVQRDRVEAPFVTYTPRDGSEVQLLLISLPANAETLPALYDVMQSLEIIPLNGPRNLGRREFTITGENSDVISETYARLDGDNVKGFTLIWPRGDEKRRLKTLGEMRQSFRSVPGEVLPAATAPLDAGSRQKILAGFDVRQPKSSFTGFFADASGAVLTAAEPLQNCARITVGDSDGTMTLLASDPVNGFALLSPEERLIPIRFANLGNVEPPLGSEIAISGYSFGGLLGAPTITYGEVEDLTALDGRDTVTRLAMLAQPGDIGAPVLDGRGQVQGLLLPPPTSGNRALPEDVRYAVDAAALADFLAQNGVAARSGEGGETLHPVQLAQQAADMTVLLRCWN